MDDSKRSLTLASLVGAAIGVTLGALLLLAWLTLGVLDPTASAGGAGPVWRLERLAMAVRARAGAAGVAHPPKANELRLVLGYRQYDADCAACHGAPGTIRTLWARSMRPEPVDLTAAPTPWSAKELFWIICHGVAGSGMPAFGARRTDDEVWNLVLFVRGLPDMRPESYRTLKAFYGPAPARFEMTPDAACLTQR